MNARGDYMSRGQNADEQTSNLPSRPEAPAVPRISYCLANAQGERLRTREADRVFYAASTMKLAVLIAAIHQVWSHELSLDAQLEATRSFGGTSNTDFVLSGDHLDDEFPLPRTRVTVATMLNSMISRSSNEATNMVMTLVGWPAMAAVVQNCGLRQTRIERLIGDPIAMQQGLTNETSAADLARLIRTAASGKFYESLDRLPKELVDLMTGCLERQTADPIVSSLPAGVRRGSKSGMIQGVRHDVAFIGDPESPDALYFAVCTEGIDQAAADVLIAALTDALVVPLL